MKRVLLPVLIGCAVLSSCVHERAQRAEPRQFAAGAFTEPAEPVVAPSVKTRGPYVDIIAALPKGELRNDAFAIVRQLAKDNASPELREKLGALLVKNGFPELAIAPLRDAFYLRPGRLSIAATLSQAYVDANRGNDALALANRLVEERPYEHGRWLFLAEIQRRLGQADDALASAGRCLLIEPGAHEARAVLGSIYADQGRVPLARQLLKEALAGGGGEPKVLNHRLAQLAMSEEKWQEALDYLERSIKEDGSYAPARNDRGVVYARLGRWSEAKSEFDAAVKAEPALAEAHVNQANMLIDEGNREAAHAAMEAAKQVGTDPAGFFVAAGRLYALEVSTATGRETALGFLKRARALVPSETKSAIDRAVAKIESLPPPAIPKGPQVAPVMKKSPAAKQSSVPVEPTQSEAPPAEKQESPVPTVPVPSAPKESTPADRAERYRPAVD